MSNNKCSLTSSRVNELSQDPKRGASRSLTRKGKAKLRGLVGLGKTDWERGLGPVYLPSGPPDVGYLYQPLPDLSGIPTMLETTVRSEHVYALHERRREGLHELIEPQFIMFLH